MSKINNLIGKKIGRLVILSQANSNYKGRAMWLCRCSCGTEKVILGDYLTRPGNKGVRSCGCLVSEVHTKHGAYLPNADIQFHIKFTLLQAIKDRSKRRGYESDLELTDMPEIPKSCPVLHTIFNLYRKNSEGVGKGKGRNRHDSSPTIDRLNSNLPYLKKYKDNLFVISWRANKLKSDGKLMEFESLVEYMRNRGTLQECESSLMDSKPFSVIGGNEAESLIGTVND